ncbi:Rieske (2Fe-2S) protein [Algoriphagus sp. C2-6-M1]|uniref:QcrA and Rieske domain-containing protein n=1 Tax=Algoriphagus persicinus TaxID=3108754 RepID=UPI002B3D81C4|nr:Rieske (2Fe-2S) protein [Algoriphagus sp. C2-6-M1]MEB2780558.1 Rieske (2Fe-2S) protein [Algoriphagus sp. C2-6-M1]
MKRKEFLKTCGWGCLSLIAGASSLTSCAGTKYLPAALEGGFMLVPLDAFLVNAEDNLDNYRPYLVAHNESLQYPIAVFRNSETDYRALWMRCTHQGTELQVFGDRFQCPAHGSEFTNTGAVQNGPADSPLRSFPVQIEANSIKIDLR